MTPANRDERAAVQKQRRKGAHSELAIAFNAAKLLFLTEDGGVYRQKNLVSELSVAQAQQLLSTRDVTGRVRRKLIEALRACRNGVQRCHFVTWREPGSLLQEICTGHGSGTMVRPDHDGYHGVRAATLADVPVIVSLLSQHHLLVGELQEWMPRDVSGRLDRFIVYSRDGTTRACLCLDPCGEERVGIIRSFAVHQDYVDSAIGHAMQGARLDLSDFLRF